MFLIASYERISIDLSTGVSAGPAGGGGPCPEGSRDITPPEDDRPENDLHHMRGSASPDKWPGGLRSTDMFRPFFTFNEAICTEVEDAETVAGHPTWGHRVLTGGWLNMSWAHCPICLPCGRE
jgi:hypothetical protein